MALMAVCCHVDAQEVSPVDFMKFNPYQVNANAAFREPYYGYFGLGVGNVNIAQRNTGLYYDRLFQFDAQGRPTLVDLQQFASSLKSENAFSVSLNEELLGIGRQLRHGYLNLGFRWRLQGEGAFTDDLFRLIAHGNGAFLGTDHPADIDVNAHLLAYQELAVGYQIDLNDRLSIGVRGKFLLGTASLNTEACKVKLVTDADTYAIRLYEDIALRVNSPVPFAIVGDSLQMLKSRFDFADLFGNPGFGVDLAADYRINDQFSIVAAVNDLGFIRWKKNGTSVRGDLGDAGQFYDDGSFFFNGLSGDELQHILTDATYREQFMDTLKGYFRLESSPLGQSYTTMLHTSMLLRGCYTLDESNRFFVQALGYCSGVGFRPALTMAYNGSFFDILDVSASYTMMRGSYFNLGLGLGLKLGIVQLYAATNNVLGVFRPVNTQNFNAQVGFVFNIPYNYKDSGTAMHSPGN